MTLRFRDLAVFVALPQLRKKVQRTRKLGLITLLDYQRLSILAATVCYTSKLDGDVIEFGSYKGGSAGLILQCIDKRKTLHICDSFQGMPQVAHADNFHRQGDFSDTLATDVEKGLRELGSNFEMHVGFFNQTIPVLEKDSTLRLSLAHIDADLYESILDALAFTYPRMQKGGAIIFDDYGSPTCLGAKRAVDEFFSDKHERIEELSGPAYGCLVGGGSIHQALLPELAFPFGSPSLADMIFGRK